MRLAWRNILFYKGRSLATFLLTFCAALLLIFYAALMQGSHRTMLHSNLGIYTGALQLQHQRYQEEGGSEHLIFGAAHWVDLLRRTPEVTAVSARLETVGIAASRLASGAVVLTGVDFSAEADLSALQKALKSGVYASEGLCLYVGSDLARKLEVGLHDELSFIGSAPDRGFVAERFEVCGIFKTGLYDFDLNYAFLNRAAFDTLFRTHDTASVIAVALDDPLHAEAIGARIAPLLEPHLRLYPWQELLEDLLQMLSLDKIFGYVSLGLFFLVIFFVVMIYSFINVSSRIKTFGMLRSIGMRQRQIDIVLLLETLILSLGALALAAPLGGFLAAWFELHPIIIEGIAENYKSYGIVSDAMPTCFDPASILRQSALILLLNLLSILYPIGYLRRFSPTEAMRHV
ncbi:MAG: ABC transporter permease [Campylobacterales bacterium]|nr:ABC transporter permease [Campylobacterales bacterium]